MTRSSQTIESLPNPERFKPRSFVRVRYLDTHWFMNYRESD